MASVETLATPERLEAARPPSIWRKLLRHRLCKLLVKLIFKFYNQFYKLFLHFIKK